MKHTGSRDEIPSTPMEFLPVSSLPDSPAWTYELKLDGYRGQAIHKRLLIIKTVFTPSERLQLSEHFAGPVSRFVRAVRRMGGEGVVAKRLNSVYEPGRRSGAWSKMRLNIGQEFVIGGFTAGSNGVDALVVGFYSGRSLMYAARVRAGLIPATRRILQASGWLNEIEPLAVSSD